MPSTAYGPKDGARAAAWDRRGGLKERERETSNHMASLLLVTSSNARVPSSDARLLAPPSSDALVTSSFVLLVVMPGATSSVLHRAWMIST